MKNKLLLIVTVLVSGLCAKSYATDYIVSAGGSGGSYATISAACSTAVSGDRIIVYPKPGGASYSEGTLVLNKSVQILSAVEGVYYTVSGNIQISPSVAGLKISIMQMKLIDGVIAATTNAPAGPRCEVNIINDSLMHFVGQMDFAYNNYNLTLANCVTSHSVIARYGKFIGNKITANTTYGLNIHSESAVTDDTVMVIGNKVIQGSASSSALGISWSSNSAYFHIYNNFVLLNYQNVTYVGSGIEVSNARQSASGQNYIVNNTIKREYGYCYYGVYCVVPSSVCRVDIENNLHWVGSVYYGIYVSGGTLNIHYNMVTGGAYAGFTNDGSNGTLANTSIDADGAITNPLSNAINGGNPDSAMADLDLSRNDCGAYGGSFSLSNFFPNGVNDWARVFLVMAPRRVLVNGTIQVKAFGYDK